MSSDLDVWEKFNIHTVCYVVWSIGHTSCAHHHTLHAMLLILSVQCKLTAHNGVLCEHADMKAEVKSGSS